MDDFKLDTDLLEMLRRVRRDVLALFNELRLRGEDGDVTGKVRIERVPTLAKNNFKHLTSRSGPLTRNVAWRLVDFLEGDPRERFSTRAREALRTVQLDHRMTALRESQPWRDAAARLKEALGARSGDCSSTTADTEGAGGIEEAAAPEFAPIASDAAPPPSNQPDARRAKVLAAGLGLALLFVVVSALFWTRSTPDPRYACLALERATPAERAAHFAVSPRVAPPPPAASPQAREHVYPISDPPGGPVQSIWTTSQFSYGDWSTPSRPGGGRSDFRLRVGGWGDTYVSLLQVPIPTNRLVHKAVVRLTVMGEVDSSRATAMTLRVVQERWQVGASPADRLWWRDCPHSSAVRNNLPPAGRPDSTYDVDVTDLYNLWARGGLSPYGIMLEPEKIGSWRPDRKQYSNFSTFYSTRAREQENRPRLVLTY